MRKKILATVLAISIVIGSISVAHAESYIITSSWGSSVTIPYEELLDLAALVTIEVTAGRTTASPGATVQVRNSGTTYYIAIVNASGTVVGYVGSSTSHDVYVASGRGYLYNLVSEIDTYCSNIQSLLTGLANSVSNLYSSDPTNPKILNNIYLMMQNTYYCSYSVDSNNEPYPINHITRAVADYMVAELNMKMQGRKIWYINDAGGQYEYYFINAHYNQAGYIGITIKPVNQSGYYNTYLCDSRRYMFVADSGGSGSSAFDDTDILNAIDDLDIDITGSISDLGVTINQSINQNLQLVNPNLYCTSSGSAEFKISKKTADAMIAFINSECLGKPINYVASSGTLTKFYIRGCYFYPSNNRIRVTLEYENGNAYSTTCYLCNKYLYKYVVENDSIETTILNIPTHVDALGLYLQELGLKLDNIYNWLDNADLVTNDDLDEMLTEFENDIKDSDTKIKRGVKLFKTTFGYTDDEYLLGDFNSCIQFMQEFWEGYDNE